MPGYSFIQLLRGDESNWRDRIFYEYFWEYDFPMTPTVFGVRTDKFKYIRYQGIWDRNEFYDWMEETDGMKIPLYKTLGTRNTDFKHQNQY